MTWYKVSRYYHSSRTNQNPSDLISIISFKFVFQTTFKAPLGSEPVVVDLLGLGKGTAWINGNNIGRYWPAFLSTEDGCSTECNYRGAYYAEKCQTNCGEPTQRWYIF